MSWRVRLIEHWPRLWRRRWTLRRCPTSWSGFRTVNFGPIVTLGDGFAAYPVLAATSSGIVAAWTDGAPSASAIVVRALSAPR